MRLVPEVGATAVGRRTGLNVDDAILPQKFWEDLGINLHGFARISWQKGKEQASGLCAWRERVESCRDLSEVVG